MTDSTEEESADAVQPVEVVGNQDWFLTQMIETVINRGVEIGVTLTVGGSVVSGMLISGKTYFEELGELLTGASKAEGDVASALGEAWPAYAQLYEKPEGAGDDWIEPPATYIHLRNAYYLMPGSGSLPGKPGMLWRGRISSVDGFSIGNINMD